ncbi:MAG: hypothetical protein II304_08920 [Bacteroidales bacterium]|nr:hypothetical protein [Bacteroidales bacterium]
MIKYHDNINGVQYGNDHTLTNNWNPDCDYGNEYVRVYFRIDTPTYRYNNGFTTEEERNKWFAEARGLIKSFGILEDCGYEVENSKDKQAYLYAHPQNISGVVLKNEVKKIAEAITDMELSSIRWVDLYETVYSISDSEYENYLDGKQEEICKELFEKSSTTRRTKYYNAIDVARDIAGLIRLNRLGLDDGKTCNSGQTVDYVLKMADKMIEEGYLKCFVDNDIKYIRSLNKTEQKKMKKFL